MIVRFGGTREVPAGITRALNWASGFSEATAFTELPDGRLLVAQQTGAVRVVQSDGTFLSAPMLTVAVDSFQDRGLIGVVAHPQFSSNGFIYVYYTVPASQGNLHYRLSRFTVSGNTAGGEVVLADLPAVSSGIHGGGGLRFGTDGKLYVGVGEAGVPTNAQNLNTPYGKLLRFNDDGSIPSDNPFCTTQGKLACAVWAYGLRNPFTLAVQPGTGRILINDVGSSRWEEIDVAARGANYGWPASEGPIGVTGAITGPFFTYSHSAASPPGSAPAALLSAAASSEAPSIPIAAPSLPLARRLLLHRLRYVLRRLHRSEQQQRRLFVRYHAGRADGAGGHARRPRRRTTDSATLQHLAFHGSVVRARPASGPSGALSVRTIRRPRKNFSPSAALEAPALTHGTSLAPAPKTLAAQHASTRLIGAPEFERRTARPRSCGGAPPSRTGSGRTSSASSRRTSASGPTRPTPSTCLRPCASSA